MWTRVWGASRRDWENKGQVRRCTLGSWAHTSFTSNDFLQLTVLLFLEWVKNGGGGKVFRYTERPPWLAWQLGGAVNSQVNSVYFFITKLSNLPKLPVICQTHDQVLKYLCKRGNGSFYSVHACFSNGVSSFSNQTWSFHVRGEGQSGFSCSQVASLIINSRRPVLVSRIVIPFLFHQIY